MKAAPNLTKAENINIFWARLMIEECVRWGVKMFCVSPGSRSTPLVIGLQRVLEENPDVKIMVGADERAAAFYALGYARATRIPAALICTSGTAVANYLPAVVEAAQDAVPMLILSADRPPELRESGANQTIYQPNIFGQYVRWQCDIPCPSEEIAPEFVLTTIDQALFRATNPPSGAVHLNCMFREPLAPLTKPFSEDYANTIQDWQKSKKPWTEYAPSRIVPSDESIRAVTGILRNAAAPLLCVGRLNTREERDAVMQCAYMWRMPIVADIASGLRLHDLPSTITYFDQILLAPEILANTTPDAVFHVGGAFTSKRLLQWFGTVKPEHYIICEETPFRHDPNHQATMRLQGNIPEIMKLLYKAASSVHAESPLAVNAYRASQAVESFLEDYCSRSVENNEPISEITAAMLVSKHLPLDTGLFLSNSMPIRDMDMLALAGHESGYVAVGTNRGASGIDGIVATASGFAAGLKNPVTLMIGDLALLHDANSLLIAARNHAPVIIVAINNNGGGIFSFLPLANLPESQPESLSEQAFERFWGTPTNVSFEHLANFADLEYHAPKTTQEFEKAYKKALKRSLEDSRSCLIEIRTERQANYQEHKALQTSITQALRALFV